jgi:hypothetical protein
MTSGSSEVFRPDERVDEIDGDDQRDRAAECEFEHVGSPQMRPQKAT